MVRKWNTYNRGVIKCALASLISGLKQLMMRYQLFVCPICLISRVQNLLSRKVRLKGTKKKSLQTLHLKANNIIK